MATPILIVDDYPVARETVRSLLIWHSMEVCGEAENGKQAIEKVKELSPDLVLLDINMPEMNGVQAAYEIRRIAPSAKILFFTVHDTPESMAAAHLIVDGFVPKSAAGTKLIPEVKRVLNVCNARRSPLNGRVGYRKAQRLCRVKATMLPPFDIFRVEADGGTLWIKSAADLKSARLAVKELMASSPGEYLIHS